MLTVRNFWKSKDQTSKFKLLFTLFCKQALKLFTM